MARHNEIGDIGEGIAASWLRSNNFVILARNYRTRVGEIDILAMRNLEVHLIEVKSVSYETKKMLERAVSHETWMPEEKISPQKLKKLLLLAEEYLAERSQTTHIHIDAVAVLLVPHEKYARVRYLPDINL